MNSSNVIYNKKDVISKTDEYTGMKPRLLQNKSHLETHFKYTNALLLLCTMHSFYGLGKKNRQSNLQRYIRVMMPRVTPYAKKNIPHKLVELLSFTIE